MRGHDAKSLGASAGAMFEGAKHWRRGAGIGTVFDGGDTLAGAAGPDQSFFLIPGIHVRD